MKFKIHDRRSSDKGLKKPTNNTPNHIQQQLINFVKSSYKEGLDLVSFNKVPDESILIKKIVTDFLVKSPNLKHMYGILYNTVDRYFYFEDVTPKTFRDAFLKHMEAIRN